MIKDLPAVILPVSFVALAIFGVVWHYRRAASILENWAYNHRFRILSREYRYFFRGPFTWFSSKNQVVYYVTVENKNGEVRTGWVRCGSYFLGLWSDDVDVQWER
jgi:hypothetical protein